MASSAGRRLVFAAIPTVLLLVVAAVAAEAWLRVKGVSLDEHHLLAGPLNPDNPSPDRFCYRPSPTRGYEPIPGTCDRDELGLYAPDYELEKQGVTYRILVLGDSVADLRRWVDGLEQELSERLPDRKVELWNSGVPSYNICTEAQVFAELGATVQPDLVLHQLCLNDLGVTPVAMPTEGGGVRLYSGDASYEFPRYILASRLLTVALVRLRLGGGPAAERSPRAMLQRAESCLDRLVALTRDQGVPLLSVVFPAMVDDLSQHRDPRGDTANLNFAQAEQWAREHIEARGVDLYELREPLAARHSLEAIRNVPGDVWHPDNEGQATIATLLADYIADSVVPPAR